MNAKMYSIIVSTLAGKLTFHVTSVTGILQNTPAGRIYSALTGEFYPAEIGEI